MRLSPLRGFCSQYAMAAETETAVRHNTECLAAFPRWLAEGEEKRNIGVRPPNGSLWPRIMHVAEWMLSTYAICPMQSLPFAVTLYSRIIWSRFLRNHRRNLTVKTHAIILHPFCMMIMMMLSLLILILLLLVLVGMTTTINNEFQ